MSAISFGCTLSFGATLAIAAFTDVAGLPALPLLAGGFVLANADLLWARFRDWRYRRGRGGGGRGDHRGGRGGGGGRGGAQGGNAAGQQQTERPKKENILDLSKYMDKQITVKFSGGREGKSMVVQMDRTYQPLLHENGSLTGVKSLERSRATTS